MLTSYKRLFAIPGGWNFSLAGFILRLPISMLYLAIVLFVVAETDSYSLAGAISMVSSIVLAVATPLWSRAADQFGQNKILSITAPIHIIFLGLFVYFVIQMLKFGVGFSVPSSLNPLLLVQDRWFDVVGFMS